jgi:peptidoglycan/xylan/chitin deacetylase (PgdA/CDA1 family)
MTAVPILSYHSISDGGTKRFVKFTLPREIFAQQMKWISDQGYMPITVADYARRICSHEALPEKPIIITFDDGFADFYRAVLPVLLEFHFSASLFVVTSDLDRTSRWLKPEGEENREMLTWSQLFEVQKAGIECGTHSETHIHLDTARPDVARQEIFRSKEILEQKLGTPVYTIAYPYGHYTKSVRQMVVEAGYNAACAVRNLMSHTNDDLFGLARITISHRTDVADLTAILTGKGFALAQRYEYPWVTAWRQVRRIRQMISHTSQ